MAALASPASIPEQLATRREPMSADHPDPIEPGTAIEVRNRFDGRWAKGFEVSAVVDEGYRVRRLSDGGELPTVFAFEVIRRPRDRRRDTWWY
jgi:hypothetical protein